MLIRSNSIYRLLTRSNSIYRLLTRSNLILSSLARSNLVFHSLERSNFISHLLTRSNIKTEIKTTVIFTHELVRCSKATSVSGKIIITKAKLQAISDAIAMCSEKTFKNSEIWMYMNSQMTLQRLNTKSNVNARLFDDIQQNLINLSQKQCQNHIQWISSCKNIIENEKADQLIKIAAQEVSVINNMKAIIISFVKKQICKKMKLQWLEIWKSSIKKGNQYRKIISNVNLSHKSLKELRKIDKLTFSTFIQLKMRHDYFKSYLHRLSENNSNKCYEICNARQTSKHLLLNCSHYRAEQRKRKKKAQFKNTDIILTLFIIKIERIATLEYLKNTRITMRKWLLVDWSRQVKYSTRKVLNWVETFLKKCRVELRSWTQELESSWEAWLDNSTRQLDLIRQDIR